ncbi:MAG TPA: hypothetical protein VNZ45_08615 [Bacteroidia bacterium]|nr:hypothetical protein [Bacteroidia bacterium]
MFRKDILPKVKANLHRLYPNASHIYPAPSRVNDSIQLVRFNCNCKEDSSFMDITFDTNGNWIHKDIMISIKKLPTYIFTYLIDNGSQNYEYNENVIMKSVDNKGEISYSINIAEKVEGPMIGRWIYVLKFKSSGEFISKEKRWVNI